MLNNDDNNNDGWSMIKKEINGWTVLMSNLLP